MNTKDIGKKIVTLVYLGIITVITLGVFEWVSTYFEYQQMPEYEELSGEIKLRSQPQDVVYATSYQTSDGGEAVKYAYMTDEVPPATGEDIVRRTENSQTEVLEVRVGEEGEKIEKLKTTFYSTPQFYEDEGKWRQVEYATTTPEVFSMSGALPYVKRRELVERLIPGESAFALTGGPYYPDPNTESTTVDGYVGYDASVSFADTRSAATGIYVDDSGQYIYAYAASGQGDSCAPYGCLYDYWAIYRSAILFNTSGLPDSINISAGTLELYGYSKGDDDNDGEDTVTVVSSAPASDTAVVTGDYDSFGTTALASTVDITSMSTAAYNTFTLNGSGYGAVSRTGITKLGIREGHDVSGNAVIQYAYNYGFFYSADYTGTTRDPKLTITYELVTFSLGQWFPF